MTTRKNFAFAGTAALVLAGCATPGPGHVYWAAANSTEIHDLEPATDTVRSLDGHVAREETVVGLAYDSFTDFLFVRLAPGDIVRVLNRPANSRVRDLRLRPELAAPAGTAAVNALDLAVRSRNRHIFAVDPRDAAVAEYTLEGVAVRDIAIAHPPPGPIGGLAYDQQRDRLVVLFATSPAVLAEVTLEGIITHQAELDRAVRPVSLGCDSDSGDYFVPLADGAIGAFGRDGRLLRRHPVPGGVTPAAIGAGPRAFLRLF
jgi:hypothetical protein